IYAQPGVLRLVERGNETALSAAAGALRGASRVWLAGVGSSWHAALVGEHLLAGLGKLGAKARAVVASEWTASGPPPAPGDAPRARRDPRSARVAAWPGVVGRSRRAVGEAPALLVRRRRAQRRHRARGRAETLGDGVAARGRLRAGVVPAWSVGGAGGRRRPRAHRAARARARPRAGRRAR